MGHAAAAAISGTDCVNHYGGLAFWLIRLKMCTQTATRQPVKKNLDPDGLFGDRG